MREHSTRARVLFFLEIEKVAKLAIGETVIPKCSSRGDLSTLPIPENSGP